MKKLKISILIVLSCISIIARGQNGIDPDDRYNFCSGEEIYYGYYDHDHELTNCEFKWSVTNGTIDDGGSFNSEEGVWEYTTEHDAVNVVWNSNGNDGVINVSLSNCDDFYASLEATGYYFHKDFDGADLPSLEGDHVVPFEGGTEKYSLSEDIYYNNLTKQGYADKYYWVIPPGWSISGEVSDGATPIITNGIEVYITPDATTGGSITVWGESDCDPPVQSEHIDIDVSRTFPSFSIEQSTSNEFVYGDRTPIQLSVPEWEFATYNWTKPTTWQWDGPSNTASVTVIPDGCNGGTVSVDVDVPAANKSTSKSFDFTVVPFGNRTPSIAGSDVVCTGGKTYTIDNLPGANTNVIWDVSSNLDIDGGQGTGNLYVSAKSNTNNGRGEIMATLNIANCPSVEIREKDIWAGKPSQYYRSSKP